MTATEILQRSQIIAREMGAMVARLELELLFPLVKTTTMILAKKGKLPKDLRVDRDIVDVVFISNLAQAQRAEDTEALQHFAAIVDGFAQLDPAASQVFNADEAVRVAAENLQISRRIVRGKADVEQRVETARNNAAAIAGAGAPPNGPSNPATSQNI